MKRSILLSIMLIAGIVGIAGFSAAEFTDYEFTEKTVTAGTLDLDFDTTGTLDCTPITLLDTDSEVDCSFKVRNSGNLDDAELYLQIVTTKYACTDAANGGANDSSEFCTAAAGTLTGAQFDIIDVVVTDGDSDVWPPSDPYNLATAEAANCVQIDSDLDNDEVETWTFTLKVLDNLTNTMQGDALKVRLNLKLVEDDADFVGFNCLAEE